MHENLSEIYMLLRYFAAAIKHWNLFEMCNGIVFKTQFFLTDLSIPKFYFYILSCI